jgi:hypothetical protein
MENITNNNTFDVNTFVQLYTNCMSKSSESTLEIAYVVAEAKSKLHKDDFKEFCTAIGYETSSATISKMVAIGKKYDVLMPHANKLPASWTTLYYIAQQPDEVIKADIESKFINPLMTGKALAKYGCHPQGKKNVGEINVVAKAEASPEPLSIMGIMYDKPTGEKAVTMKALIDQLRDLGLEFVMGDELKEALEVRVGV